VRARCGACATEVDVAGVGRFKCPACGAVNQVSGGLGGPTAPPPANPTIPSPPAMPVPPAEPSPRIVCPDCAFSFIVGAVDMATCPKCQADVPVGARPSGD
jgi:Zn finger protein HypA/HybF involved in hydrogenase expression